MGSRGEALGGYQGRSPDGCSRLLPRSKRSFRGGLGTTPQYAPNLNLSRSSIIILHKLIFDVLGIFDRRLTSIKTPKFNCF